MNTDIIGLEDPVIIQARRKLLDLALMHDVTYEKYQAILEEVFIAGYNEGYDDGGEDACNFEYGNLSDLKKRF